MSQVFTDKRVTNESKLFELLQNDLRVLSCDAKKRFPLIKEACEEGIVKLRYAQSNPQKTPLFYVVNQILYPFVQGCETKDQKIVKICLSMIQKLITEQVVDQKAARCITDTLWMLMESGTEEVKLLQSVTLLLTTNGIVHGDVLAKNLVLCFRLHFAKDATTVNAAGATIRQLVSLVFERLAAECDTEKKTGFDPYDVDLPELRAVKNVPPRGLSHTAADAFLLLQDLMLLVSGDQPCWLTGMIEMTRTFGLELLEMILVKFPQIFHHYPHFSFLLKERVCALVIKLFSPNIKFRSSAAISTFPQDKPNIAVSVRLCRVVEILVHRYQCLLVTECEIFLSLIIKFLDPDIPIWQRSLALEVLHHLLIDPGSVTSLCQSYDLKPHSTNIFHDMVQSIGSYIQGELFNGGNASNSGQTTTIQNYVSTQSSNSGGPGTSPQPGFFSKGTWYPLLNSASGHARSTYLDILDKTEPPLVAEWYGVSVAFLCLMDLVNSLSSITDCSATKPNDEEKSSLHVQLVVSSWSGVLTGLIPLIDSCADEQTTERLLQAVSKFVGFCGTLSLEGPRDSFITAVCKACLPPQYSLSIFKTNSSTPSTNFSCNSADGNSPYNLPGYGVESDYRQQVVAVGTPLPSASLPQGAHQGPVMLTSKNLQCMRSLLDLALQHGSVLSNAWHLILTTLQHLVWILRLKPTTGGSLKAGKMAADANAVITTAVMADLPVLSTMLSKLFEASQHLSDVSLHHLIHALCQLSQEAMELAYSNREPSLFAVAKLLETGLVNLDRIEVYWRPLTSHLLEVCQHPHIRMREWGVEAITYLLKVALQHKYNPPLRSNQTLQTLILLPLSELSCVPHNDVRQRQLECMLYVLHLSGDTLCYGWPLVLNTIAAVSDLQGENLIRLAFQCLQLVVTDFLPVMPWSYLPHCVNTTAKFGSQTRELNISLTAVGLMWNVSDYFYQNYEKLSESLANDTTVLPDFPGNPDMPPFDKLMMCLFTKLGELCVDARPAVRKSAGQTLFATIAAHGGLLSEKTWQPVLCQVLFPLLEKVRSLSNTASNEKVDTGSNILIHHSRNTAQKQWAETQVSTVLGAAKVFESKRGILQKLGDFARFWSLFMEYLEGTALSHNDEVSLSALKAFQEMLYWRIKRSSEDVGQVVDVKNLPKEEEVIRINAWQVWLNIGFESTSEERCASAPPCQPFLTALMQIFPDVFLPIRSRFGKDELKRLGDVLKCALLVPPHGENSFIMPAVTDNSISHLQDGVLDSIELIAMGIADQTSPSNITEMIDGIFDRLIDFIKVISVEKLDDSGIQSRSSESTTVNFAPFVERTVEIVGWFYERAGSSKLALEGQVLEKVVVALKEPMCTKHLENSAQSGLWKLAVTTLLRVLRIGLPLARENPQYFSTFWSALGSTLEEFLFSGPGVNKERGSDENKADEAVDCQIVELIREQVLEHYAQVPRDFLMQVVVLLNMGSMHSVPEPGRYGESTVLREDLAKVCFETLLEFSLMGKDGEENDNPESTVVGRLAVTSLLHRFQNVLQTFIEEDALAGKCPLPRYQVSEVSFVLKAVTTLVQSLKKAPAEKVGKTAWQQLIDLYPCLVNCITATTSDIGGPLKEALLQYSFLLQPNNTK